MFNNLTEQIKIKPRKFHPVYITRYTEDTQSGLFRWETGRDKSGFRAEGENVMVLQDCALIIIVDGIKQKQGKCELSLSKNGVSIQKYIENTKKKNTFVRLTYSGTFRTNNVISVTANNIKDIQITVYGNLI